MIAIPITMRFWPKVRIKGIYRAVIPKNNVFY